MITGTTTGATDQISRRSPMTLLRSRARCCGGGSAKKSVHGTLLLMAAAVCMSATTCHRVTRSPRTMQTCSARRANTTLNGVFLKADTNLFSSNAHAAAANTTFAILSDSHAAQARVLKVTFPLRRHSRSRDIHRGRQTGVEQGGGDKNVNINIITQ